MNVVSERPLKKNLPVTVIKTLPTTKQTPTPIQNQRKPKNNSCNVSHLEFDAGAA